MGVCASIQYEGLSGNASSFLLDQNLIQNSQSCRSRGSRRKAFAKYIKDGTWQEKIRNRLPRNFLEAKKGSNVKFGFSLAQLTEIECQSTGSISNSVTSKSLLLSIDEQRIFFLTAITENFLGSKILELWQQNFILSRSNSTSGNLRMLNAVSHSISDRNMLVRKEVYRAQDLLSKVAMHFDEDDFSSFLADDSWIQDLIKIVDNLEIPITICDASMGPDHSFLPLLYANKAWEKMTGCSATENVEKSLVSLMCRESEKGQLSMIEEAVNSAIALKVGLTCQRSDGSNFLNLMSFSPVLESNSGKCKLVAVSHIDTMSQSMLKLKPSVSEAKLRLADEMMTWLPLIVKIPNVKSGEETVVSITHRR